VDIFGYAVTAVLAYLLGSIPTGFLVAQAKGIDIRSVGSGNIGATNVFRILGKQAGIFVLLADAAKGWAAVALLPRLAAVLFQLPHDPVTREPFAIVAGLAAILGHNYTCWLYFKGGKGIATSAGVLTALVPWALLIILSLWIAVFLLTRYVSLASISACFALPFATLLTGGSAALVVVTGAMGALGILKHHANIQRLFHGTENRFNFKNKEAAK
jgi:glycerol-3-phosphate acyltransferase PlsY